MNDEPMRQKRWRKKLKRKREIERRLKAYGSTSKPSVIKVVEKPKEEKVWIDSSKVKETTLLKRIIRFLSRGKWGK